MKIAKEIDQIKEKIDFAYVYTDQSLEEIQEKVNNCGLLQNAMKMAIYII